MRAVLATAGTGMRPASSLAISNFFVLRSQSAACSRTYDFWKSVIGLPARAVKASMAVDTLALFSFLPEMAGTSYFMYDFSGPEGPWGIVRGPDATPLPIYRAFQATHPMFAYRNEEVASTDYATPAKFAVICDGGVLPV